jgi:hypothetical protein
MSTGLGVSFDVDALFHLERCLLVLSDSVRLLDIVVDYPNECDKPAFQIRSINGWSLV